MNNDVSMYLLFSNINLYEKNIYHNILTYHCVMIILFEVQLILELFCTYLIL